MPQTQKELKLYVKKYPKDFSIKFKNDLVERTFKAALEHGKKVSS